MRNRNTVTIVDQRTVTMMTGTKRKRKKDRGDEIDNHLTLGVEPVVRALVREMFLLGKKKNREDDGMIIGEEEIVGIGCTDGIVGTKMMIMSK